MDKRVKYCSFWLRLSPLVNKVVLGVLRGKMLHDTIGNQAYFW